MGILKKAVGKVLGISDYSSEVNDYLASVKNVTGTSDIEELGKRRMTTGTKSYSTGQLITMGNELAQRLKAAGEDRLFRKVSNTVFRLGKERRR